MKLKHLLIINAIISLGYAFGELLITKTMLALYFGAETPTAETILAARYFGWGLLAVGLICAFVANAPPSATKQAIVKALFIADIVGLIVSLMGILDGTFNALGWSAVVIYVFLAAGYGYFWFIKPESA
jgi:hypothetical protein